MNIELFTTYMKSFLKKYNFIINFQIESFEIYQDGNFNVKMYLITMPDKERMLHKITQDLHINLMKDFNKISLSFSISRPGIAFLEI